MKHMQREGKREREGASIPEQDEAITHFHLLHSLLMGLAFGFANCILIIDEKRISVRNAWVYD